MAEELSDNKLTVKTPWGEISATGQFIINLLCYIALGALFVLGLKDMRDQVALQIRQDIASHEKLNVEVQETINARFYELAKQLKDIRQDNEYRSILLRSVCRNLVPAQYTYQCEPKYFGFEESELTGQVKRVTPK